MTPLSFLKNFVDHDVHVRKVLEVLRCHKLCAKLEKCEFSTSQTEFLGYIVSSSGISMDPSKVKAVIDWPSPTNVKAVQSFCVLLTSIVVLLRIFLPLFVL